jgi:hypothetical protein
MVGSLGTVLNEGSVLCIRNDVRLYRQLFGPVMDCACHIRICVTRTQVGKTQVIEENY